MARRLSVTVERFPLAAAFTISRGSKTEAVVVVATISDEFGTGRGECVPYARYGETPESVVEAMETVRDAIEAGMSRRTLSTRLPAGAARNALDCALWDLEAKSTGTLVEEAICRLPARPLETVSYTHLTLPTIYSV